MFKFIGKLFDFSEKELKKIRTVVEEINSFEGKIKKLSDKELSSKTIEFKEKISSGVPSEQLLPEAFAVVREAALRVIGQRHFDVQMMAAICLWQGKIAEQKTGEGKTLSATPALYLRALEGKGAHLVTVNDYLAKIGCGWMGPIFSFLGLSVGCIIPNKSFVYDPGFKISADDERLVHLKQVERKVAYQADITYGVNNEFGFDYLRDNMVSNISEAVQRKHYFAIVDEVDFALIDEARTPLIISSPYEEPVDKYYRFSELTSQLSQGTDFVIDEKAKTAMLTEFGIRKVERMLGVNNLYEEDFETIHQIENALKARTLFQRDRDYVVKDNRVVIVDEFTGRLMEGRRWSDGLHQAIEAKEGVPIEKESKTWATITFQNYFRMYEVLSGMTGTALTEAEEFKKIYGLDVLPIPTNKPIKRIDYPDVIYKTQRAKYGAVVAEIEACYQRGQPVLVGTTSIEKNEMISSFLRKKGIPHQVLNAKHHEKEAGIISQAGKSKAVTIATNMAGRGVDIILGGPPPDKNQNPRLKMQDLKREYQEWERKHNEVIDLGGLYVIGTERHEARRIDNQLRGRSGRQGDPGMSKFFISLEDDLMRVFGGEQISSLMTRFNMPEEMPISHPIVNKMIQQVQIKIEGFNFDIRKSLVEFDDIVNKQREIIYKMRRQILEEFDSDKEKAKEIVLEKLREEIILITKTNFSIEKDSLERIIMSFAELVAVDEHGFREGLLNKIIKLNDSEIAERLFKEAEKLYKKREELVGAENLREIEKSLFLYTIDQLWVDHLTLLENLRESVRLRGYGQRDPLVEYRKESYEIFQELLRKINYHFTRRIFRVEVRFDFLSPEKAVESRGRLSDSVELKTSLKNSEIKVKPVSSNNRPGRNEPCPCGAKKADGSPKKYKHCCYPKYG